MQSLWQWFTDTSSVLVGAQKTAVAVVGSLISAVTLSQIGQSLTILFLGLQIFFLLRDKWWRQRGKRAGKSFK